MNDSRREERNKHKPYLFVSLVLACVLLTLMDYFHIIPAWLFIPSSFLFIIVAGLLYGRKALGFALFLGIVQMVLPPPIGGSLIPDSLLSAGMFILVAFFAGTLVEQKRRLEDENLRTSEKNQKLDQEKRAVLAELKASQIAGATAGRKLKLLSGLTHNDIFNNLSALIGSIDLMKTKITDPELLEDISRAEKIANTIKRQIEFARTYESIGLSAPQWLNVDRQIHALLSSVPEQEITFSISIKGLEIFVDPLFEKVFANLINNSLTHGVRVSHISVSHLPFNRDIAIVYEDDGIGVHAVDKMIIFEKGIGKNPGFGLFLSKEILSITGLSVKECGVYGKGARFEIFIPEGKFRFV